MTMIPFSHGLVAVVARTFGLSGPASTTCRTPVALVAVAAVVLQGCATAGSRAPAPATEPQPAPTAEPAPAAEQPTPSAAVEPTRPTAVRAAELEAIYRARAEAARERYHEADVHFMTGMIGHHGQALVMSGFAPANDASPTIQILCARIINAQKDEIAVMQEWLADRDLPVPQLHTEGGQFMVHGPEHAMHMPGMLSPAQLDELRHARGPDFDRLFLRYMIMHHEGAVTMVEELFAVDGAAQGDFVFKLASDIQADQASEIARMKLMLDALQPDPQQQQPIPFPGS